MSSTWKLTVRTVSISILLGFGAGVLGTALTSSYLSDYALTLGQLTSPDRLSEELPRSTPSTYADAVREITESVFPGVAQVYATASATDPYASGAVLTSDGWIVMSKEYAPPSGSSVAVVGGTSYPVTDMAFDPSTTVVFLKVDASNLPVFAFGSGFDLLPGDQVFIPTSSRSMFVETVVESRWPTGGISSDVPQRRVMVENPLLGNYPGAPVVNTRGELVGIVLGSGAGFTSVLPIDGVLSVFNATLREGNAVRAALGVSSTDLSRNLGLTESQTLGLTQGALLSGASSVKKGSAAAAAGLAAGDIIVSVDGTPVDAHRSLDELIVTHAPGDMITLRVISESGEREVKVTLGTL